MEFLRKYGWLLLIVVLVIIYFSFKSKIDKWLGMAKSLTVPSWASCKSTFFVKLPDGKFQSVTTTDEGTTGNPIPAYYKNDVEFNENGVVNPGTSIKITKEEFDSMCQYMYNPPYAWYTEEQKGTSAGHPGRTGKKMAMGGIIDYSVSNEKVGNRTFWNFDSITSTPNGSILTGSSDLPLPLRAKIPVNIRFTFSDGNSATFNKNISSVMGPRKILVNGLFPSPVGVAITSKTVSTI